MNLGRTLKVASLDLSHNARRPLFWIFLLILGLVSWGLSTGHMLISSGESTVGGTKAWLTSEFAMSQMLSLVVMLFYGFFVAIAAGMSIIHDDDLKVGRVLHATPLKSSEYVYGKFLAVIVSFAVVLVIHLGFAMFFNHVVPSAAADEIRGPFGLANYFRPGLLFALPTILFFAGTSFLVGTWTRKPILVFVFPVIVMLLTGFFLWEWSPSWLDPKINAMLMAVDPSGVRWITETWLKVDRGVQFYNSAPVGLDAVFLGNRLVLLAIALGSVMIAHARFARHLRGETLSKKDRARAAAIEAGTAEAQPVKKKRSKRDEAAEPAAAPSVLSRGLAGLRMTSGAPGFFAGAWIVARAELKELRSQPGLYLFVPLILIQTLGEAFFNTGPFDTPLLHTAGTLSTAVSFPMVTLVALLMLFYTVESLERERRSGFASIALATPIRTGALLLGKASANIAIIVAVLLIGFVACMAALAIQGRVPLDPTPFVLVWGLMLLPTHIAWIGFVMAVQSLVRNRYTTYAVALGALILTGYRQATGGMNWVGNWTLWNTLQWSDLGVFELDRLALTLNRLFVLSLGVLFVALTVKWFTRADRDVSRMGARLAPSALAAATLRLAPFWIAPVVLGAILFSQVQTGHQGPPAEKKQKDYWRRNLATWRDAKNPKAVTVDLDLELDPPKRLLKSKGSYVLINPHGEPLRQIALTRGLHWKETAWTLNGATVEPEDRLGLMVFTPGRPMAPGDTLTIGWSFEGLYPNGVSKNGGGASEFVLPSGVVLTSFTPSFSPVIGYLEQVGIDKENQYDAKEYPPDFHEGVTEAAFGSGHNLTTRVRISGPAEYLYNSVGVKESESVENGRRTVVWASDHPVNFFNVVAGKWEAREGEGTVIYHHAEHAYNLDEMVEALDGARKYFSEWFHPFPWQTLKVSEFPALAGYAQGFPTNITFSEAIGFLAKSDPRANVAFMVTAHEAAHQWWGNILLPGKGPGGNILSEGMAHFSTVLLFDQVKGERQRVEFCRRIEESYGDRRQVDSERPLVMIDGTKAGDGTVQYDKGGWVFWMLMNHMGRERALAGMQDFIRRYQHGPDHAVLYDFVAVMREHADDKAAYDAFAAQWFFDVVVPEYKIRDAKVTGDGPDYEVTFEIENMGESTMPLDIAVTRGERWPKEEKPRFDDLTRADGPAPGARGGVDAVAAASDPATGAKEKKPDPKKAYREVRTTIVIGPGEMPYKKAKAFDVGVKPVGSAGAKAVPSKQRVTIRVPFEPEKIVVDPDARVLQLNRDQAVTEL